MLLVNEKLKPFYKILAAKHTRDNRAGAREPGLDFFFFLSYVKRKRDL